MAGQDDMARRYPRAAAVLPYPFALVAVPLTGVRRSWGGIVLMWPAGRAGSRHANAATSPPAPGAWPVSWTTPPQPPSLPDLPRVVPVDATRHPAQTGLAAADYLERLPEGALTLDLKGRVTFMSTTAAPTGSWAPDPGSPWGGSTTPSTRTITARRWSAAPRLLHRAPPTRPAADLPAPSGHQRHQRPRPAEHGAGR
ncbi:hypothetical protein ACFWJ5_35765 [Streptomyces qaidamensis]|uniref:hypothetical protein n=1 Tax=Streptomyces qaidamensis TaxID=1783515 RepID=UPI003659D0D0